MPLHNSSLALLRMYHNLFGLFINHLMRSFIHSFIHDCAHKQEKAHYIHVKGDSSSQSNLINYKMFITF